MDRSGNYESEPIPVLSPEERPGFYDLERNTEAGFARRAFERYLTTRNYNRSIKMYRILGTPLIQKIVMNTTGKLSRPGKGGNYRLDSKKSRIEAATDFAYGKSASVYNETAHTIGALITGTFATVETLANNFNDVMTEISTGVNVGAFAINVALVALQRYNRARMIKLVDSELRSGRTYSPEYENSFGIDHRAVENYEASLQGDLTSESSLDNTPELDIKAAFTVPPEALSQSELL